MTSADKRATFIKHLWANLANKVCTDQPETLEEMYLASAHCVWLWHLIESLAIDGPH